MTPEERDLISGLFERMRGMGSIDKDREAEDFIARSVRQTPDAAYMMVQTVLVQENALQQAGDRIEDLEERVRELERGQPRAAAQGGGSFLGGIFGGGRSQEEPRSGSVPPIGSRREPSRYDEPQGSGSPWGQQRAGAFGQAAQQQGGGGGFLRGAMTTAAGVAGGMLLANSISGMMGGNASGKAQASEASAKPEESSPYEVNQKPEEAQQSHYQDASDNDPGNYDGGSSWGDGGGDMDI